MILLLVAVLLLFVLGAPSWAADNLLFELVESNLSPPVPDKE